MKNENDKKWSSRFNEPVSEIVKEYTASIEFDKKLALFDIKGSIAHATMLQHIGVIDSNELNLIKKGMNEIIQEIKNKDIKWTVELEDIHMNIEKKLIEKIGDVGKKLHTARSRNDQAATDLRLWLRYSIDEILKGIRLIQSSLIELAEKNITIIMPGFTHLQVAQPVNFAHYMLAYVEMFGRDFERITDCRKRVDSMPLGAAALAGTSFPIDRTLTAKLLNFESICQNSLDAVSDRDFITEFLSCASIMMIHFSRLSEELILWMSPNFAFIDISDSFCTGSSIMPQKKNPDVAELTRGKTGRIIGHLMSLLVLMKSQPLAYNKDNQEDKEPVFDAVNTLVKTLNIYSQMIAGIKVNSNNMKKALQKGYATATDFADYLVRKGLSFRDSHNIVSLAVNHAEKKGCDLKDLDIDELKKLSKLIDNDVYKFLDIEGSVQSRNHLGGTSFEQVKYQLNRWKKIIKK